MLRCFKQNWKHFFCIISCPIFFSKNLILILNAIFPLSLYECLHDFIFFMFLSTYGLYKETETNQNDLWLPLHIHAYCVSQITTVFPRMFSSISNIYFSNLQTLQLPLTSWRTDTTPPLAVTSWSWLTAIPVLTAQQTHKTTKVPLELTGNFLHSVDTNLIYFCYPTVL